MNKTYSFYELVTEKIKVSDTEFENINSIEIPAIQRDYAQGRIDYDSVAENFEDQLKGSGFINSIFEHLLTNKEMTMDFVYGSFLNGTFIPLDGQQRLTTLFLLYWYIGKVELTDGFRNLAQKLESFTYQTRDSDRKFCKYLCTENVMIDSEKSILDTIRNEHWYFSAYSKDPTISAMFNMLSVIETKYKSLPKLKEPDNYLKRLEQLRFYILPLTNFNLSDDLYVKMNARGKKLSTYENFKADITNWMNDISNPFYDFFSEIVKYDDRDVAESFRISLKFDNEWTDEIWSIVKENTRQLNEPFMQLFHRYALNKYLVFAPLDAKTKSSSELFKRFSGVYENEYNEKHFQDFEYIFKLNQNNGSNVMKDFEIFFDRYHANSSDISRDIQPSWLDNNEEPYSIFISTVNNEKAFTARYRIAFYGIQKYLENFDYDKILFKQWMRIVWNIAQNTDITDTSVMIGVLQLIDELGAHANSIYNFLSDRNNIIQSKSSKIAIEEERKKAGYIINQPDINWEENFIKAEKHPFFKGSIDFLIDENITSKQFLHRVNMAEKLFDTDGIVAKFRDRGHILLRGIISNYSSYENFYTNEYKRHRKFFTDIKESENYLKKMLTPGSDSSDTVFITTINRYLDEKDEKSLFAILETETNRPSQVYKNEKKRGVLNNNFLRNLKYAHESLYSIGPVQDWMQRNDAIRFENSNNNLFVAKPRAWYDWICFDEYRREIAKYLFSKGFESDSRIGKTSICVGYAGCYKQINKQEYCIWFNTNGDVNLKIDEIDKPKLKLNYRKAIEKEESITDFCTKLSQKFGI